jgi:hypothetical protein
MAQPASRGTAWLDGLFFDLRLAIRGLRRDPGFCLTAIAMLAVALALNVSVYTIRDAMVDRGLPIARDSERLVYIALRTPSDMACCPGPVRFPDFEAWRAGASAFEDLALPLTIAGGPLLLVAVALIGCRIPVGRAIRVDPVVALRHD